MAVYVLSIDCTVHNFIVHQKQSGHMYNSLCVSVHTKISFACKVEDSNRRLEDG